MNPDEVHRLLTEYESTVPIRQLAEEFSINRTTVVSILERNGAERRAGIVDRNLDEARQLYDTGSSLAEIGQHFNVDPETVRRVLKKNGVVMRKQWERT